jgi:putative DNA methylase
MTMSKRLRPFGPRRLIEVDLPIKRISAHARREKSIRHGHISTLHIWWARRPLAACRAVICASLWLDPVDLVGWAERGDEVRAGDAVVRPQRFLGTAQACMTAWALDHAGKASADSYRNLITVQQKPETLGEPAFLRRTLLDFIADFANWENSTDRDYIATARALTQAAHEALGGEPGTKPLVVDPFAGGGSIPLEALRVGTDVFASDLNPVAVLLNKVILEYVPRYGQSLADEVRKWGNWVKEEAEKTLANLYPKDPDGAIPIAYLWARTIRCEGPGCGTEVPLIRSLWLSTKANRSVALQILPDPEARRIDLRIIAKQPGGWVDQSNRAKRVERPSFDGTVKRGSATCPCCGYTTPANRVRDQIKSRSGGTNDARMLAVVLSRPGKRFRYYRLPTDLDKQATHRAQEELERWKTAHKDQLSLVPDEPTPKGGGKGAGRAFSQRIYGMRTFSELFTARQLLTLTTLVRLVREAGKTAENEVGRDLAMAVTTVLGLCCSKLSDLLNSLCAWQPSNDRATHLFARQAIQITWDFAESTGAAEAVGNFGVSITNIARILDREAGKYQAGHAEQASATEHPLPDDTGTALITDPPYYDAVPYSDLSDFFYVWLRRAIGDVGLLPNDPTTPKNDECIVDDTKGQDAVYFERCMTQSLAEARRVVKPDGIGVVVFAHKSTRGWEAQLQAMIDAGWVITGSWPIDTEWATRLRAIDSAALASSVHLVCRPRECDDGSMIIDTVGDWRDVLQELPSRIHAWLPRLSEEGIVGADAIFACLGPALEIFSRYARVEKASGEEVTLREYLEQVWAAVAREALSMIFEGAETIGFEADARLAAIWLWTLNTAANAGDGGRTEDEETEDEGTSSPVKLSGYFLEYDAARKIAQGLGAHLDKLTSVVQIKGDKARLLPVAERASFLFGRDKVEPGLPRRGKPRQLDMFGGIGEAEEAPGVGVASVFRPGETALDRLHQAMLLFASGRGEALKRFLVEEGVGRDQRLWRLAQTLSALYPAPTEEKRWVDGVLARKKGLGL